MDSKEFKAQARPSPDVQLEDNQQVTRDEQYLAILGKRQQLQRNFSLLSIVGLSCTLMLTWEGALALLQPLVLNGGPTGAFAGYLFVFAGVGVQTLVMGEMASMIPLAGGAYNWVAILAPPRYKNLMSYLTGWATTIAWQGQLASTCFLNATLIQALATLSYPGYVYERWHATLIFYAILLFCILMNTYLGKLLPGFEGLILIIHVCGFIAILITLCYLAPKNSPELVFQTFINGGEWATNGESFLVGSITSMFVFVGIDASTHLAEEIKNAPMTIPLSMISTLVLNGVTGLAMLIAILFCMGSLDDVLSSTFFFPFVPIFANITGSVQGAVGMTCVILIVTIPGSVGLLTTASRMLWAFSREGGVPGSRYISRIEPRSSLPIWAICITCVVQCLLALIIIGSTTAFYAFTNLTVAGFYSTFIAAASAMLYKRLTTPADQIRYGPFKLGKAGVPLTVIALAYSLVGWFFSFWPPLQATTVKTFNWSVVVYFGTMIIALGWWIVKARHSYTGPRKEI